MNPAEPAGMPLKRRMPILTGGLLVVLVVFGLLADRALVGQARASRAAAAAQADETARLTAVAVRAALGEIEQSLARDLAPAAVAVDRVALPPHLSLPVVSGPPYASRSRAELSRLLSSRDTTASGLPEAVVARLLLGAAPAVSGADAAPDVAEQLLSGQLPVRADDLPYLARRLGRGHDSRIAGLQRLLRRIPPVESIPTLPAFARRLVGGATVEGWGRSPASVRRYEIALATLLNRCNGAGDAVLAPQSIGEKLGRAEGQPRLDMTRFIAVPDVDGLTLAVTPRVPSAFRLAALRLVLLLSVLAGILGLVAASRALGRESQAIARERAFLSNVTHELRSPLAAIRLLGERLAEGLGDARDYGVLVARESERLEALVEKVLAATRIDTEPRFSDVGPSELARSALEIIAPRAERRHVRLELVEHEPLSQARWDQDAVRRALINLLDNAVVHGKEGGRVALRASVEGGEARLAVSDDGPGIGRAQRGRLFGRFARGASTAPGTGLGLYLVEQVARAHGGRVDLVTEEGRGSTFTLILPLVPPGAEAGP